MNEMLNDVLQHNLHSITYLFIQDGARNTGNEALTQNGKQVLYPPTWVFLEGNQRKLNKIIHRDVKQTAQEYRSHRPEVKQHHFRLYDINTTCKVKSRRK